MRIIAGQAKGRKLKAPRGLITRPTSERVREAVFDILEARFGVAERVLDLYAGTGAFALEALSRGARHATLIEEDHTAVELIRENAARLDLTAAEVVCAPVVRWLKRGGSGVGRFGCIFLDPPYRSHETGELDKALGLLGAAELLADGGVLLAEHDWRHPPDEGYGRLKLVQRRRYGQTAVSIYQSSDGGAP